MAASTFSFQYLAFTGVEYLNHLENPKETYHHYLIRYQRTYPTSTFVLPFSYPLVYWFRSPHHTTAYSTYLPAYLASIALGTAFRGMFLHVWVWSIVLSAISSL